MIFRLHHETVGGHVRCRLFAGPHDGALGQCGEFVMRADEFSAYAFLHKDSMQFRPELGGVAPSYIIPFTQSEIDEVAGLCDLTQGWPLSRPLWEKIVKYRTEDGFESNK